MELTIEKKEPVATSIDEEAIIQDQTGNEWILSITANKIYIIYSGRLGDRFASLRVRSTDGMEFKSDHNNIFATKNSNFELYYAIRSVIKRNETLGVWGNIQRGVLENPLEIQLNV